MLQVGDRVRLRAPVPTPALALCSRDGDVLEVLALDRGADRVTLRILSASGEEIGSVILSLASFSATEYVPLAKRDDYEFEPIADCTQAAQLLERIARASRSR